MGHDDITSYTSIMLRDENPKIVGILFTEDFKLFRRGSFYPLGTVDGFPFIDDENRNDDKRNRRDLYGEVLRKTLHVPFDMDVRAVV